MNCNFAAERGVLGEHELPNGRRVSATRETNGRELITGALASVFLQLLIRQSELRMG